MMRFPTCYQNKTEAIAYFHKTYLSILYVPVGPTRQAGLHGLLLGLGYPLRYPEKVRNRQELNH